MQAGKKAKGCIYQTSLEPEYKLIALVLPVRAVPFATWRNKREQLCKEKLDLQGRKTSSQRAVAQLLGSSLSGGQCLELDRGVSR